MKIYCSNRIDLNNLSKEEICDWLIDKPYWIEVENYDTSGYYMKILNKKNISNEIWYDYKFFFLNEDAPIYIFDVGQVLEYIPEPVRPISLLTDKEVNSLIIWTFTHR